MMPWLRGLGLLIPLAFASAAAIHAQPLLHAKPLASQEIDRDVARTMAQLQVPGAAIGVIQDGKVVLAKGYGVRVIGQVAPVDTETVFSIASLSKSFTTAVMATLVDEGRLDWDRPVHDYLPSFQMYDPVAAQLMTPRDLASHRSGLPRHDFLRFSTYMQPADLVRRLRYLPPSRTFRDGYQYNNLMYATAGYLAGQVAGSTWDDLVRRRIFAPIGMTRSNTSPLQSERDPNHATGHRLEQGRVVITPFYQYEKFGVAPAGAVASTVTDMLKYLQMYLDQGRVGARQVISVAQVEQLHRPVTPHDDAAYALGWSRTHRGGQTILQHGGSIDGFTAQMTLLPQSRAAVVVLNNLDGSRLPALLAGRITDLLLGILPSDGAATQKPRGSSEPLLPERIPRTHPTLALQAYVGNYTHPAYGTIHLAQRGKNLVVQFDALELPLTHYHYDVFRSDGYDGLGGGLWQFQLDTAGQVRQLLAPLEASVPPLVFEKEPAASPTAKEKTH